eukprot:13828478-Alexandrium_andersonii.AAC.1
MPARPRRKAQQRTSDDRARTLAPARPWTLGPRAPPLPRAQASNRPSHVRRKPPWPPTQPPTPHPHPHHHHTRARKTAERARARKGGGRKPSAKHRAALTLAYSVYLRQTAPCNAG